MLYVALDKDLGLGQRFCFCGVWIDVLKALDRVRTPHVFMSQSSPFDTLCALSYFNKSTRLRDCLAYSSDCTRGIDEPPKEIGNFPFHTILVIDKSMLGGWNGWN